MLVFWEYSIRVVLEYTKLCLEAAQPDYRSALERVSTWTIIALATEHQVTR